MPQINKLIPQALPAKKPSSEWLPMPPPPTAIRTRYGDAAAFLLTFSPALQQQVAAHVEQAYLGFAPTLSGVTSCYGQPTTITWLCAMLEDLNDFTAIRDKMELPQQIALSNILLSEYHYLKVTELQLFFYRIKCGRYGRFYGVVDPLFVSSSLISFLAERHREILLYEDERHKTAKTLALQQAEPCITYEEYLVLKQSKKQTK